MNRHKLSPSIFRENISLKYIMSSTHIVAPTESGLVYVAGPNTNGQLSLGTTTQTNTATFAKLDASTNMTSILQAADGSGHSLFLRSTGLVYASGLNANGQLGLGTLTDVSYAALVQQSAGVDMSNVVSVAAGVSHSLFLLGDGTAYSCGLNTSGQLADTTTTQRTYPVIMKSSLMPPEPTAVKTMSYNFDNNVTNSVNGNVSNGINIMYSNTVYKTGTHSIIGDGSTSHVNLDAFTLTNPDMTVAFFFNIIGDNQVNGGGWLWISYQGTDLNYYGVSFTGTAESKIRLTTPYLGFGLGGASLATVSLNTWYHIAVVNSSAGIKVYLDGTQVFTDASSQVLLSTYSVNRVLGFPGGTGFTKAYMDDFVFYKSALSQSDVQGLVARGNGALINPISSVSSIAAGDSHSLTVKSDGTILASGLNTTGQLGLGTLVNANSLQQVKRDASTNLTGITQSAAGGTHSVGLTTTGTVYAWGGNTAGQLANGTTVDASYATLCLSAAATTLTGIIQVAAGAAHTLFLKSDGTVFACGSNTAGQLGDGTLVNKSYPVQVLTGLSTPLTGVSVVHASVNQSYFLTRDGYVYACGFNGTGAFGNGTTTNSSYAVIGITPNVTSFKNLGYSSNYLRKIGATVANLVAVGYSTLEIVCAGYTKAELSGASISIATMRNAGVTYKQLAFAGYTDSELIAAGYTSPIITPSTF